MVTLRDALIDVAARVDTPRYRVSDHAPGTVEDLIRSFGETRELVIWSGASERTIWGAPELNWHFRAWHDWCHIRSGLGFTAGQEIELARWQCGDAGIQDVLASVVREEIEEQARFFLEHDHFLDGDQLAFARDAVARLEARRIVPRIGG